MLGLVVTPTTWSRAARLARLPETSRSRLRSSSQIETPARVSAARLSVIESPFRPPALRRRALPSVRHPGQREELRARPRVRAQRAEQGRGAGRGPESPYPAQRHARVLRLQHDARAARVQPRGEAVRYLGPGAAALVAVGRAGQWRPSSAQRRAHAAYSADPCAPSRPRRGPQHPLEGLARAGPGPFLGAGHGTRPPLRGPGPPAGLPCPPPPTP